MSESPLPVNERHTAHVLFMDLVGFSRLSAPEQKRSVEKLRDMLRETPEFIGATASQRVACLPAGDGAAVLFFSEPSAPIRCALQLQKAAQDRGGLRIRLGIHSGPVERTTDINGNLNFVGPGMNLAQRVMDCGDAEHILVSGSAAQLLVQSGTYVECLHELGSTTVKHQQRIALFSFHGEGFGNPQIPEKLLLGPDRSDAPSVTTTAAIDTPPTGPTILVVHSECLGASEEILLGLQRAWTAAGGVVLPQPPGTHRMVWAERLIQCIHDAEAIVLFRNGASGGGEVFEAASSLARDVGRRRGGSPRVFHLDVDGHVASTEVASTAPPAGLRPPDGFWTVSSVDDVPKVASELLERLRPAQGITQHSLATEGGPTVGPVPLTSPHYVLRPSDDDFATAIERRDTVILVKGARQMGKTSLLSRGLQHLRKEDARLVFTDFQKWHDSDLASTESFFLSLAESFAFDLQLDVQPNVRWNTSRAPGINFERYLVREVLMKSPRPFVWAMDEVDRLLDFGFSSEVFGLFRSWYGARQMDPDGPWSRLMLVIAYATEAHYFIRDPNQSPFNVGTSIRLRDFNPPEIAQLNQRLQCPLRSEAEIARFHRLVGGQPFLVRCGLNEMKRRNIDVGAFEKAALRDDGPFNDHLQHLLFRLARSPELLEVAKAILRGKRCPTVESFFQLRTAGILSGDSPLDARLRCELYHAYLDRHLR